MKIKSFGIKTNTNDCFYEMKVSHDGVNVDTFSREGMPKEVVEAWEHFTGRFTVMLLGEENKRCQLFLKIKDPEDKAGYELGANFLWPISGKLFEVKDSGIELQYIARETINDLRSQEQTLQTYNRIQQFENQNSCYDALKDFFKAVESNYAAITNFESSQLQMFSSNATGGKVIKMA